MNTFVVCYQIQLPNSLEEIRKAFEAEATKFNIAHDSKMIMISVEQIDTNLMDDPSMGSDLPLTNKVTNTK